MMHRWTPDRWRTTVLTVNAAGPTPGTLAVDLVLGALAMSSE